MASVAQARRTSYPDLSPLRAIAPAASPATARPDRRPKPPEFEWEDGSRTTLAIRGRSYAVERCTFDPRSGVTQLWALTNDEGDTYHVAEMGHGKAPAECTCADYEFRHRDSGTGGHCKHIAALADLADLDPGPEVPADAMDRGQLRREARGAR